MIRIGLLLSVATLSGCGKEHANNRKPVTPYGLSEQDIEPTYSFVPTSRTDLRSFMNGQNWFKKKTPVGPQQLFALPQSACFKEEFQKLTTQATGDTVTLFGQISLDRCQLAQLPGSVEAKEASSAMSVFWQFRCNGSLAGNIQRVASYLELSEALQPFSSFELMCPEGSLYQIISRSRLEVRLSGNMRSDTAQHSFLWSSMLASSVSAPDLKSPCTFTREDMVVTQSGGCLITRREVVMKDLIAGREGPEHESEDYERLEGAGLVKDLASRNNRFEAGTWDVTKNRWSGRVSYLETAGSWTMQRDDVTESGTFP